MAATQHLRWDPAQYQRHGRDRSRPLTELVARVPELPDRPAIADLGCGPGGPTLSLFGRWPDARITGLDNSPEMLAEARAKAGDRSARSVRFVEADLASWRPAEPWDLLIANAALQWVPDHHLRFPDWVAGLAPGGVLAFQVPGNHAAPSHRLMREVAERPRWRARLAGVLRTDPPVLTPEGYLAELSPLCADVDVWETTYLHRLAGDDAVLDWVSGTGLRPVLTALEDDPEARTAFVAEYAAELRTAYPADAHGTVFPFRRVFAVARRAA
ncbi:trans-aconitate 2-methyltransferase [Streptomyces sp. NBRC 109706]|uniref:trans-aconitate 2-methyltransferase n=1 Tax=Streptomyces sp. NBRC 109706 TaxID=1550035 RepID=UPI000784D607|nr:trans-aconitate 2-methyltransferase [Streptomyces sp. NBRC 109706]